MSSSRRGPASRSRCACRPCRKRHLKCNEQKPCANCQNSKSCCEYDHEDFTAKEWRPGNAGRLQSQVTLSPVGGTSSPSSTAGHAFIHETDATASFYNVTSSSAFPTPVHYRHAPSSDALAPRQTAIQGPTSTAISPLATSVFPSNNRTPSWPGVDADLFYLDKYCHVIGPWFDLFDQDRTFSLVVPHLSLENPILRLSSLACASRQHHLLSHSNVNTTLGYYDDALRMLTISLRDEAASSSAAVFASCLFLAHCEMVGASTQDWHLHIAGTYSLISTHGWHGRSGGLGQACFWIYCRMDLLSSLAAGEQTRLGTSLWLPLQHHLPEIWTSDAWANHTVFILAQVHNFLCKIRQTPSFESHLFSEWQSLHNSIDLHEQNQPSIFRPLVSLPASNDSPFPSNLYISELVSAALQMFDLARFFLVLSRPERSRSERIARFHAQNEIAAVFVDRIIANSVVNRHDINWATAVPLLTSAGYALVGWRKRKALLECLSDIQRSTGWNTRDNLRGLLRWWGWAGLLENDDWGWRAVGHEIREDSPPGHALMKVFEWHSPEIS